MKATTLTIPIVRRGEITDETIQLDSIFQAEARAEEIQAVTPQKAPELLVTFNKAYLDLTEMVAKLKYEQARAEDEMNKVRARILVDEMPSLLKAKGLANSADTRQALIDLDTNYQVAKDRVDMIEATVEYLKGKVKFMENAYTSVKKIIGEQAWNMTGDARRRQLDGLLEEDNEKKAGQQARPYRPNFGKPI